jgi:hypothetical protein
MRGFSSVCVIALLTAGCGPTEAEKEAQRKLDEATQRLKSTLDDMTPPPVNVRVVK